MPPLFGCDPRMQDSCECRRVAQDFGTIRKRLQQARRRGWASGHYKGAHEVWVDAQLVFNNCVTFNSTAADQQTRDMTEKVRVGGIWVMVCRMPRKHAVYGQQDPHLTSCDRQPFCITARTLIEGEEGVRGEVGVSGFAADRSAGAKG